MCDRRNSFKNAVEKLFGEIPMGWFALIVYAIGAAVLTAAMLVIPVFKDTSFERIGATLEAWIFFVVIIMANCKKPLESALKVFVFFLISQPLIYLFQVPFSWLGWGIFGYYKFWFILTLFTFPAAFVGWYIIKKNWLTVLIFAPVIALLAYLAYNCGSTCIESFPRLLVATLFCFGQIILYIYVFFPEWQQKVVGFAVAIAVVVVLALAPKEVSFATEQNLVGAPFSENATVVVDHPSVATVQIVDPESGRVYIHANGYGTTTATVIDGDETYEYIVEAKQYENMNTVTMKPAE